MLSTSLGSMEAEVEVDGDENKQDRVDVRKKLARIDARSAKLEAIDDDDLAPLLEQRRAEKRELTKWMVCLESRKR